MGDRTARRATSAGIVFGGLALLVTGCGAAPPALDQAKGQLSVAPPGVGTTKTSAVTTTSAGTTTTVAPPPVTAAPTTAAPTTTTPALSGIEVGPGPQAAYSVQPQPTPGSCHYGSSGPDPLPDPRCTPGAINPQVTQASISSTICSPGYTTSIRPPESITEPEKIASAAAYGYEGPLHVAEYDHLIPLELGGDPNDPANLWVEPNDRPGATSTYNSKDTLEGTLNRLVCSGQMTLDAARQAIATDWASAFEQYG